MNSTTTGAKGDLSDCLLCWAALTGSQLIKLASGTSTGQTQQQERIPAQRMPQPPASSCFSTFPRSVRCSHSYSRDRLQVLLLLVVLTALVPGCSVRIKLTLWCFQEGFFPNPALWHHFGGCAPISKLSTPEPWATLQSRAGRAIP